MVRIVASCLLLCASFQLSFGKSVDENTAKNIGYNFCKVQGGQVGVGSFALAYTATSSVNGAVVNDFYVFNTGATGFVIVAADDNVVPVLAYSTESSFRAGYIPDNINGWLNNYKKQISYVIKNGINATTATQAQWSDLAQAQHGALAKTTYGGAVMPLLKTNWNQSPNYNYLCPYDNTADTNVVTGCVATAMAQVMKYWNWPEHGVGTHNYSAGTYGTLSANFGDTYYHWDSMPNSITTNNYAIGNLMLQAGISVNMDYGVDGSAAYVVNQWSPITNDAQYALTSYFSYKASLQGLLRTSYTDSNWIYTIQAELIAGRPVIYTGDGTSGGHCFVADGYVTYDRFHFNWGWGGYANGYFIVENLVPGGENFDNDQTIIIGIEPDSSVVAAVKELPAAGSTWSLYPNPASETVNIDLGTTKATQVRILDEQGREVLVKTIAPNTTTETIAVSNLTEGIYFAQIQTAQGIATKKIVVAR